MKAVASFPETRSFASKLSRISLTLTLAQAPPSKDKTSKHESIPDHSQVLNVEPSKKRLKGSEGPADVRTKLNEAVPLVTISRDPEELEHGTSAPHKDPKQPRKHKGKERQQDGSSGQHGHVAAENAVRTPNKRVRLPCIEESDISDKRSKKRLKTARDASRPETEQGGTTTSNRLVTSKKRSRELEPPVDEAKDPVTRVSIKPKQSKAEVTGDRTSPAETAPESRRVRGNQDKSGKAMQDGKGKTS